MYVIGLDQGTTGTTALLFDPKGNVVGRTYAEHQQHFPQNGWVEHNPNEIFENTISVISQLIRNASLKSNKIAGMGITNQRETTIVWDRQTSKPIHNAVVWQCRRTTQECERLKKIPKFSAFIQNTTGLTIDPYFSATKISWILKNANNTKNKMNLAFGTIDSWLLWNLTKGQAHATDLTNASRTLLFDIHKRQWSEKLCQSFKIPLSILPAVKPSQSHFGFIDSQYFGHAIPILGMVGDQQSSLFAHHATQPFQAKCTFGTGAFALVHCGDKYRKSKHKLLTTLACSEDGKSGYALEGSVFMAGSIIQWLRDELKMIERADQMDDLAKSVMNNEGVYLVPAFVGLGAPYWKPDATAAIYGMRMGAHRGHIARAALESIAYQVYDLFHAMESDIGKKITTLAVDGGVTNSTFLMQFLSDLLNIPIHKSKMVDMTALGAAKLAAVQLGYEFSNAKDFFEVFTPAKTSQLMKKNLQGWKKAVSQTLASS